MVDRSESEVQERGHTWRYSVGLMTLDELTQGVQVNMEEL